MEAEVTVVTLQNKSQSTLKIGGLSLPAGALLQLEESTARRLRRQWPELAQVSESTVAGSDELFFIEGEAGGS